MFRPILRPVLTEKSKRSSVEAPIEDFNIFTYYQPPTKNFKAKQLQPSEEISNLPLEIKGEIISYLGLPNFKQIGDSNRDFHNLYVSEMLDRFNRADSIARTNIIKNNQEHIGDLSRFMTAREKADLFLDEIINKNGSFTMIENLSDYEARLFIRDLDGTWLDYHPNIKRNLGFTYLNYPNVRDKILANADIFPNIMPVDNIGDANLMLDDIEQKLGYVPKDVMSNFFRSLSEVEDSSIHDIYLYLTDPSTSADMMAILQKAQRSR